MMKIYFFGTKVNISHVKFLQLGLLSSFKGALKLIVQLIENI